MKLAGWGRYPVAECEVVEGRAHQDVAAAIGQEGTLIPRGNGRSYGDAALNPRLTLSMQSMNRLRSFDRDTGVLRCEAGVLLADILSVFVPRGWFPPVVPGTKFVTVGGMIAADVHGKNHPDSGTFGRHVISLELVRADGTGARCSRTEAPELFQATLGGMGLTGVILSAAIQLVPTETAFFRKETRVARDLDATLALFEDSGGWTHCVAWIDCLASGGGRGRAVLSRGRPAAIADLPVELQSSPLQARSRKGGRIAGIIPPGALRRGTVRLANAARYRRSVADVGPKLVPYDPFLFPLDGFGDWNRLYGRRGLVQYQCVVPEQNAARGLQALLDRVGASPASPFLAVLKRFGAAGEGLMSFPMAGYTLALDFPVARETLDLIPELDRITAEHGGRVYLAKDASASPSAIRAGYRHLDAFDALRTGSGARQKFSSALSERLAL